MLKVKKLRVKDKSVINIKTNDNLIDLSPCIGTYQEAVFFNKYNLEKDLELQYETDRSRNNLYRGAFDQTNTQGKILVLTAMETHQNRYMTQAKNPFISKSNSKMITNRLAERFSPDEDVQIGCSIAVPYTNNEGKNTSFSAIGLADVVIKSTVYELKFVQELTHEHFLQLACYMIGLGNRMKITKGILWNVRKNEMYEVKVPDPEAFLDQVMVTITKHALRKKTA